MPSPSPWSIKGISPEARQLAKEAAQKSGMTLGQWLSEQIAAAAEADHDPTPGAEAAQTDPNHESIRFTAPRDSAPEIDVDAIADKIRDDLEDRITERFEDFATESEMRRQELESIENSVKTLITQLNGRISRASETSDKLGVRLDELSGALEVGAARAQKTETALRRVAEAIETLNDQVRFNENAIAEAAGTARAALDAAQDAASANAGPATIDLAEIDARIQTALSHRDGVDRIDWRALEVPVGPMCDAALWVEIFGAGPVPTAAAASVRSQGAHVDAEADASELVATEGSTDANAIESGPFEEDAYNDAHEQVWASESGHDETPLPGEMVSRAGFAPGADDLTQEEPDDLEADALPSFVDPAPERRLGGSPSLQRALRRLDEAQTQGEAAAAGTTEARMVETSMQALEGITGPAPDAAEVDEAVSAFDSMMPVVGAQSSDPDADPATASEDFAADDLAAEGFAEATALPTAVMEAAEKVETEAPLPEGHDATVTAEDGTDFRQRALKKLLQEPEDEWLVTSGQEAAQATDSHDAPASQDTHGRVEPGFSSDPFAAAFGGQDNDENDAEHDSAVLDLAELDAAIENSADEDDAIGFSTAVGFDAEEELDGFFAKPASIQPANGESPYSRKTSARAAVATADAEQDPFGSHGLERGDDAMAAVDSWDDGNPETEAVRNEVESDDVWREHDAHGDALDDDALGFAAWETDAQDELNDVAEWDGHEVDATDASAVAVQQASGIGSDVAGLVDWETGASAVPPTTPAPEEARPTDNVAASIRAKRSAPTVAESPAPQTAEPAAPETDAELSAAKPSDADKPKGVLGALRSMTRKKAQPNGEEAPAAGALAEAPHDAPGDVLELDEADILDEDSAFKIRESAPQRRSKSSPAISDTDFEALEELYASEEKEDEAGGSKLGVALSLSLMAVTAVASVAYIYWQGF